jgi:AcrR family transcriptional regulator
MEENITKKLILDAAISVFSEAGFGSARIEEIAKRAGVSYGTAYYYFSSKEAVFQAVVENVLDEYLDLFYEVVSVKGSNYDKLKHLVEALLDGKFKENGIRTYLISTQAFSNSDVSVEARKIAAEKVKKCDNILEMLIRGAQSEGYAAGKDAKELTALFNIVFKGTPVMCFLDNKMTLPKSDLVLSFMN